MSLLLFVARTDRPTLINAPLCVKVWSRWRENVKQETSVPARMSLLRYVARTDRPILMNAQLTAKVWRPWRGNVIQEAIRTMQGVCVRLSMIQFAELMGKPMEMLARLSVLTCKLFRTFSAEAKIKTNPCQDIHQSI